MIDSLYRATKLKIRLSKWLFFYSFILIITSFTTRAEDSPLVIVDADQLLTHGHYKIESRLFVFSGSLDQSNNSDKVSLVFGFEGREITLIADSTEQQVDLSAERLSIDSEDKAAYQLVADSLDSMLNTQDKALAHNAMLLEMMRYFSRAPIGFQPSPFDVNN